MTDRTPDFHVTWRRLDGGFDLRAIKRSTIATGMLVTANDLCIDERAGEVWRHPTLGRRPICRVVPVIDVQRGKEGR